MHYSQSAGKLYPWIACANQNLSEKEVNAMKKNVCYYLMMAAAAMGQELTPVQLKMLSNYLNG